MQQEVEVITAGAIHGVTCISRSQVRVVTEKGEYIISVQVWIQFGALLVTILALTLQQYRANTTTRNMERRTETKLKKYNPTSTFDDVETRKALYEMLHDETVRLQEDKKYRARAKSIKEVF